MVDEILAVGDEEFQRRCMEKFKDFKDDGKTIIVVSHALGTVRTMCDEVAWLDHGRLVETGDPNTIIDKYTDVQVEKVAEAHQTTTTPRTASAPPACSPSTASSSSDPTAS